MELADIGRLLLREAAGLDLGNAELGADATRHGLIVASHHAALLDPEFAELADGFGGHRAQGVAQADPAKDLPVFGDEDDTHGGRLGVGEGGGHAAGVKPLVAEPGLATHPAGGTREHRLHAAAGDLGVLLRVTPGDAGLARQPLHRLRGGMVAVVLRGGRHQQ